MRKANKRLSGKKGPTVEVPVENSPQSVPTITDEELQIMKNKMKYKIASMQTKDEIMALLDATRASRQNWILKEHPTATDIMQEYPHMKSFNGQMIDREFQKMHPQSDHFVAEFECRFAPRILKVAEKERAALLEQLTLGLEDDCLKALIILPHLMASPNFQRGKRNADKTPADKTPAVANPLRSSVHEGVFLNVKPGDNLRQVVENRRTQAKGLPVQPYLVRYGATIAYYYVVVDSVIIEIGQSPIVAADILFKLHFAFNIQYAPALDYFFKFLECFIYRIPGVRPKGVVDSLYTKIMNLV